LVSSGALIWSWHDIAHQSTKRLISQEMTHFISQYGFFFPFGGDFFPNLSLCIWSFFKIFFLL
jgi:hypothetical protein